jgi:transcriptional regulator with XRE-family HTH domain
MISAAQIRAGRALVGWSAVKLAKNSDVSINTIQRLETGAQSVGKASVDTINKITSALENAGVVLLPDGVGVTMRQDKP